MAKWVCTFGQGKAEDESGLRDLLGGKGAGLAEMTRLGLPVPPGFTITTEVCAYFYKNGKQFPPSLAAEVETALGSVGHLTGRCFGDEGNPLLVSARSGARASMPGMLDTVLNLGLNDVTVEALAESSGDPRFAYDSYRRFIQMYASVVLGIEHHIFEEILGYYKESKGVTLDTELSSEDWWKLIVDLPTTVERTLCKPCQQYPREQLWAPSAVFRSGQIRAVAYQRLHDISATLAPRSLFRPWSLATWAKRRPGRHLHRNPSTGAKELYNEFLLNAQGLDVVGASGAAKHHRAAHRCGDQTPSHGTHLARCFRRIRARGRSSRKALPRHAGHGIHHRARQTMDVADA
jgi:pyruvate,orthophosphate dikinase